MARLSVLMTVYNGMPHLAAATESVLGQTFGDFQFVIVNDGSTDGTRDYLGGLSDPRVAILDRPNGGTTAASNQGLQHCTAELVARVDADDVLLPERFAKQVAYLDQHPEVGLLGTQMAPIGAKGVGQNMRLPTEHEDIYGALADGRHGMMHATIMMRTALLKQIGGYRPIGLADDWDMMLRMGEAARLATLDEVLFHYRVHQGTLSSSSMRRTRACINYACHLASLRRRGEPEITFEQFTQLQRHRPWAARVAESIELHARTQYRLALADLYGGARWRGAARMAWAAGCSPRLTLQRVARMLSARPTTHHT